MRRALDQVLVGILTDSHILIDDVPGVGKTTLIRMLASLLGLRFARVQFTPDLMPSDITGTSVLNMKTQEFAFRPGPIFAQILLADEINRATPKTQAALLEAMQERQVTVDGVTYPLPEPFFVLATQNPVELEGTFPLPEAQLDRFMLRVRIGYPNEEQEERADYSERCLRDVACVVGFKLINLLQQGMDGCRGLLIWSVCPLAWKYSRSKQGIKDVLTHVLLDPQSSLGAPALRQVGA